MSTVISKDGTPIYYERLGEGPAVILVSPALGDKTSTTPLAALLAPDFTAISYDRRGRGESGDTLPYAVEREVEDIDALINEVGGSASIYGWSSGAVLALTAAASGLAIHKLVMFEPPFIVDGIHEPLPSDYAQQMSDLVAADRRDDAVAYFMTNIVGVPAEFVGQMKYAPMWADMTRLAHTLPYDGAIMGDTQSGNPLPADRWASVTIPALALDGGESPDWMRNASQAIADALPNAEHRTLEGQNHGVAPEVLAPVLAKFLAS